MGLIDELDELISEIEWNEIDLDGVLRQLKSIKERYDE